MTVRSRVRDLRTFVQGNYYNLNVGDTPNAAAIGLREWCDDIVGHCDQDNPFALKRWETITPLLNGRLVDERTGVTLKEFTNYPIDWQPDPENSRAVFSSFNEMERFSLAKQLLAKTNPAAPDMGVPAFLGELRDLPSLVKSWGETLLRRVATGYIVWRWVVRPMLSDIHKMCQFVSAVHKRLAELETLMKGGTIRRNVKLRRDSALTRTDVNIQSNGAGLVATRETVYTELVWGSCRWRLMEPVMLPTGLGGERNAKLALATRLVTGATSYELLAAAWELMPWSWFVDWFAGVGDFIAATNNTIGCDCESICLMRKTSSLSTYRIKVRPDWVHLGGSFFEREEFKGRYPINPWFAQFAPPLFHVPIFTYRNWSILGALAVHRIPVNVPKRKLKNNFKWVHLSDGRRALVQWKTMTKALPIL